MLQRLLVQKSPGLQESLAWTLRVSTTLINQTTSNWIQVMPSSLMRFIQMAQKIWVWGQETEWDMPIFILTVERTSRDANVLIQKFSLQLGHGMYIFHYFFNRHLTTPT